MKLLFKSIPLFLLVAFCSFSSLWSQNESVESKIKPAFKDYFGLPRASIFLHINKSAYVTGEHLWFKGYLYNRLKNNLLKEPLNLYVSIYDSVGRPIKKELFISKEGLSQGQVLIDSTFEKGTYFLKASTSWISNFREDDSFISQFEVLSGKREIRKFKDKELDIQFLPEGGHLVSEVLGTVGVKVLNKRGYGVQDITGVVYNNGDSITSFKTNRFGLSKFDFLPEKDKIYTAVVQYDKRKSQKSVLPQIQSKGIGMSIRRVSSDRIMILLGTNPATRLEMGNKPYTLLFHRDGLLKHMKVEFPKNGNYISHILDPTSLHPGTNIVTLTDSKGKPLLERLVFNRPVIKRGVLKTSIDFIDRDSVSVIIKMNQNGEGPHFLSASILPEETKAYEHQSNIFSTFLLSPYLKGHVENPKYYFTDVSENKDNNLDLLLLTQGWSRYSWDNIFENPPLIKKGFETGVDIFGKLNFDLRKKQDIMFYPGDGMLPQIIKMKEGSDSFVLENFLLERGDNLKFTIIDANGRFSKPNLYVRIDDGSTLDILHERPLEYLSTKFEYQFNGSSKFNFLLPDNTIALNEVTVEGKKEEEVYVSPFVSKGRLIKVTQKTEGNYPRLLDLIRSSGFNVWEAPNTGYDRIRITSKRPSALSLTPPSPRLYVDDIPYSDFNILIDFPTRRLESYFIDRSGNGEQGAAGGVIRVYTKKGADQDAPGLGRKYVSSDFFVHTVKSGFSPVKEFYVPKYASYNNTSFQNFGTIHWEPNIVIGNKGRTSFKFRNLNVERLKVFIEGIGMDGTIFSLMEKIQINPD
ncbi:hypothetical protein PP182_20565 [Maribacter sp. PR1]|uniref:TonB-dependent receptor plug domain-containing protein n=1 Tax=Maribacter cobaltidurans TaxID=1178778 RepID=A0ABU7IZR5_9FLAO|nr:MULTISPECIES: hypothetical protein [Maribacter]MDC6391090.1 hypothetical protein [Maribacter sp. PR1]MEE1978482.1 hypothetical protein [Maribacter cobaltidurans]